MQLSLRVLRSGSGISLVFAATLALGGTSSLPAQEPAGSVEPWPAPDSPLTTNDETLYAVGVDGRSLLTRSIYGDHAAWRVLVRDLPVERIAGLAYDDGCLFFSDGGRPAVWRLRLLTHGVDPVHRGAPFESTAQLAIVDETERLYVADPKQGQVFRLEADEASDQDSPPQRIDLPSLKGPVYLAGSERDLVITAPESGAIYYLEKEGTPFPIQYSAWRFLSISVQSKPPVEEATTTTAPVRIAAQIERIRRPGPVILYGGLIYVLDENSRQISVLRHSDPKPIRYARETALPARFVPTADHLVLLDETGEGLRLLPRLVPTAVRFPAMGAASRAMAEIYHYLCARNIMPARTVSFQKDLETTLKRERVLLAFYVSRLDFLLCELNPELCSGGRIRHDLGEGQPLRIPDLYSESRILPEEVKLEGLTLAEELDQRIQTPEFDVWKQPDSIARMNPAYGLGGSGDILQEREGTFRIPAESILYVIGFPAREIEQEESQLNRISKRFGGIKLVPLEKNRSRASQSSDVLALDIRWNEASTSFTRLLATINYSPPQPPLGTVRVGIAEAKIDESHVAFRDAAGTPVFEHFTSSGRPGEPAAAFLDSPLDDAKGRLRDYKDDDHGTGVASLVSARALEFGGRGLADRAILFSLRKDTPDINSDIEYAALVGVTVFNISQYWESKPDGLEETIDNLQESAVFLVGAGQTKGEGKEICGSELKLYPACWSDKKNVIVVAGTVLDGSMLFPAGTDGKGSNFSPKSVHVAAPGIGFYAAGWSNSYVPVGGTSFATPLVTATAALLFAKEPVSPFKIKQRIIAASEYNPDLNVKMVGGLLNVKRTVTNPRLGLLVNDNSEETFIDLIPNKRDHIDITFVAAGRLESRPIPIKDLLRVTSVGNGRKYRVTYVELDRIQVVDNVRPPDAQHPWQIRYYDVDKDGNHVGGLKETDLSDWQHYIAPVFPN